MTHRSITYAFAGMALVWSLAASPLAVPRVAAQEAIMLETIGAVRMARPEEVKRRNDEAAVARSRQAAPPAALPQRHAAVAD